MNADFLAYLKDKKIDARAFAQGEPEAYAQWAEQFAVLGRAAFDQRKKFLINPCRRRYLLKEGGAE